MKSILLDLFVYFVYNIIKNSLVKILIFYIVQGVRIWMKNQFFAVWNVLIKYIVFLIESIFAALPSLILLVFMYMVNIKNENW